MRTLVINLTRFGDLIQSQAAISGLGARGDEVGLVCLENFAGAASLLRGVDRVYPLPGARFLAALDRDWRFALRDLLAWLGELDGTFPPERVVNLTSSLGARLLARSAGHGAGAVGFALDDIGFGVHTTPWAAFLSASSLNRGCSPFNIVDLFWKVAGLGDGPRAISLREPGAGAVDEARTRLDEMCPVRASGYVAFQLGASQERRTWPTEYFAEIGAALHEAHGLVPVLLGSPAEAGLGLRYLAAGGSRPAPFVDLIGRTSLPELAATLSCCRLLLTNDTGTMHLAAGLGVPVAAIFLATAQPWDTGPYLPGSLCLEPGLDCHPCAFGSECALDGACRQAVKPRAVLDAILPFLLGEGWGKPARGDARAWVAGTGDDGFLGLRSLNGHDDDDRTLWVAAQRYFYRQFLDDGEILPWPGPPLPLSQGMREDLAALLAESDELLRLLLEQGSLLSRLPKASLKGLFMATWQRLETLWRESRFFSVLGWLWSFGAQDAGRDLPSFLASADRCRHLVRAFSTILPR